MRKSGTIARNSAAAREHQQVQKIISFQIAKKFLKFISVL